MGPRPRNDPLRPRPARAGGNDRARTSGSTNPMKKPILQAMTDRPLLGDGAMGTQLMLAGLEQGNCGEVWNLTHPERVLAIQRRYAEAGSDCILTNTFGASRLMLRRHGKADLARAVNQAGVAIAR